MELNRDQINNVLKFVDAGQDEKVKKEVFSELGRQCFFCRTVKDWVEGFDGDVQAFLDRVNVEDKSPYWKSLVFNEDRSILYLTGKEVDRCACALADCDDPPTALCTHCCKTFQAHIFRTLFQRDVRVEITESILLGGTRCSTAIHIGEQD